MEGIAFESKKFCQLSTLAVRWDCSIRHLENLAKKGVIRLWHPEGSTAQKGRRVEVSSVLDAEKKGYIEACDIS